MVSPSGKETSKPAEKVGAAQVHNCRLVSISGRPIGASFSFGVFFSPFLFGLTSEFVITVPVAARRYTYCALPSVPGSSAPRAPAGSTGRALAIFVVNSSHQDRSPVIPDSGDTISFRLNEADHYR